MATAEKNTISFEQRLNTFCQPIPPEALKKIDKKAGGKLTDINVGYVIDRLNSSFGNGGWKFETELVSSDLIKGQRIFSKNWQSQQIEEKVLSDQWNFLVRGWIKFPEYGKEFGPMYNANSKEDSTDALKSAQTGCFMQIVKYMGFGKEVHMGLFDNAAGTYTKPVPEPFTVENAIMEIEAAKDRAGLMRVYHKYTLFNNDADVISAFGKAGKKFPKQKPEPAPQN